MKLNVAIIAKADEPIGVTRLTELAVEAAERALNEGGWSLTSEPRLVPLNPDLPQPDFDTTKGTVCYQFEFDTDRDE